MKGYQTPQKEQARFAESANVRSKETQMKSISGQVKKPQKIAKLCLSSAFASVSEDISPETAKESIDSSASSEISDGNRHRELLDIIADKQESGDVAVEYHESGDSDDIKPGNAEVEIMVDFLREARLQVSNCSDVDLRSKKLLDALIKIVIEDFYHLPEEQCRFSELVSAKFRLVFLCFLLWIISISAILFSRSTAHSSPEPSPT